MVSQNGRSAGLWGPPAVSSLAVSVMRGNLGASASAPARGARAISLRGSPGGRGPVAFFLTTRLRVRPSVPEVVDG